MRWTGLILAFPTLLLPPAHAGPLDEPAGLPCRSESFRDFGGVIWADPNHRISVFAAGPIRVPGATSVTITCQVWREELGVRYLLGQEVNTTPGDTGILGGLPEERWLNGGEPPIVCTTVTWRSPAGDGGWPATGEFCLPVGEYAVIP